MSVGPTGRPLDELAAQQVGVALGSTPGVASGTLSGWPARVTTTAPGSRRSPLST